MMEKKLSIVIVEYRRVDEVKQSIASLKQYLALPYEIIVSSNSCYSDEERAQINERDERVKWLFNERNGGFAYAMNEGLRRADGDYLVIMNSDCILNSGLDDMIDFMERHPEVGAIAPQMRDDEGHIQDTARPYVSLSSYFVRQVKRVLTHQSSIMNPKMDYTQIQTVDWLIGAFIMVSRKAFEATGGLDDSYFMYAEDLDWCTRIRQQGYEVVYYPKATITYKGTRRARTNWRYAQIFIKSHLHYWLRFGFFWGYPVRKEIVFDDADSSLTV